MFVRSLGQPRLQRARSSRCLIFCLVRRTTELSVVKHLLYSTSVVSENFRAGHAGTSACSDDQTPCSILASDFALLINLTPRYSSALIAHKTHHSFTCLFASILFTLGTTSQHTLSCCTPWTPSPFRAREAVRSMNLFLRDRPGAKPNIVPLIGNLADIDSELPIASLWNLSKQYGRLSPSFGMYHKHL